MHTLQDVERVIAGHARYAAVLGDGFAFARDLKDGAVDLTVSDPPYDAQTHKGARTTKKKKNAVLEIDFAPLIDPSEFAPQLIRATKRWVICFCALKQFAAYEKAVGSDLYIRDGVWVRTNGTPQQTGDRPAQGAEGIAIMHREGRKRWNGGGKAATWTGPICSDPTREHPTKKPLWLMQALLRDFAESGDVVFDPCMGEGTTGEACLSLGLRFIGFEIDPKYHAMAVRRLERADAAGVQMTIPVRGPKAKQLGLF